MNITVNTIYFPTLLIKDYYHDRSTDKTRNVKMFC